MPIDPPQQTPSLPTLARSLCLLALLLSTAVLPAAQPPPAAATNAPAGKPPQEKFDWPAWTIPAAPIKTGTDLSFLPDADALSKRPTTNDTGQAILENSALQLRVNRREIVRGPIPIATTPVVAWTNIVPGVYRITARVKYAGDFQSIGTPIVLGVTTTISNRQAKAEQSYYAFDLAEPEIYSEISLLYEVDPTLSKQLPARRPRHAWHHADFLAEAYPGGTNRPAPPPPTVIKPPHGLQISLSLPRTAYNVGAGLPPNSLRTVTVDWLRCERIAPSLGLTVRHVRTQKRWLRPGEEQSFHTAVENFTREPLTRTLVLVLERGWGESQELTRQELTLAPGENKALTLPWLTTTNTAQFGWEIRAETRAGDKIESSSRDFFSIHQRAYEVQIAGGNHRRLDPFREKESPQNLMEVFAATPGDCAQLLPKTDAWICGMSAVAQSYPIVRAVTSHNRAMGVATHMYLFAGGTGEAVMDMHIRRPDWLGGHPNATDQVYYLRSAAREALQKHDYTQGPFAMPKIPHIEVSLNHWFPELMDQITRDAIEFAKRTGYEGIRFDVGLFAPNRTVSILGQKLPFQETDKMQHAAKNFQQFEQALRRAFPNFEFGANMDSWAYLENVGLRGITPPAPETYPEFIAFAKAGGMFMDEGTMSAPLLDHYMNRFQDALWSMSQKREMARRFGGVYQLFSPHRDGSGHFAHDDIYWTTMTIASGSTYIGSYSAAPYSEDSPGEFITRYSEFFRSPGLRPLTNAEDLIYLDSPSVLWFADTAVAEDRGRTRRYVIPIINPPVHERMRRNKSNELPPPINDPFRIEVKIPAGFRTARAWMLTWEPRVAAIPLPTTLADGKARVQFPGLKLFRTLVMEFEP
ncbi:hypothetical protein LBMAG56_38890 [Verrucomicrobiota bacterium]|nr:hypothetical protein LBMAG56_38890 [Verrucomicrobiota bacterium]